MTLEDDKFHVVSEKDSERPPYVESGAALREIVARQAGNPAIARPLALPIIDSVTGRDFGEFFDWYTRGADVVRISERSVPLGTVPMLDLE